MKPQRNMSGVLFKNDRKEKDSHPDYQGSIQVDGVDYYLSAWIKSGNNGKFMSLAVKPKEEPKRPSTSQSGSRHTNADLDQDIPF